MSLTAVEQAAIERWSGTIDVDDATSLDLRMDRLGDPYVVALEILLVRLSDVLNDPLRMRIDGDVTFENDRNVEALRPKIAALTTYCKGIAGLNYEARQLVEQGMAASSGEPVARWISYELSNTRPGA